MQRFKLNHVYNGMCYKHNTYKVIKITDCYITVLYNQVFKRRFKIQESQGMQHFIHDKDIITA